MGAETNDTWIPTAFDEIVGHVDPQGLVDTMNESKGDSHKGFNSHRRKPTSPFLGGLEKASHSRRLLGSFYVTYIPRSKQLRSRRVFIGAVLDTGAPLPELDKKKRSRTVHVRLTPQSRHTMSK